MFKRKRSSLTPEFTAGDVLDIGIALDSADDPVTTLRELGPGTEHLIALFQTRTRKDIEDALRRWWMQ